MLLWPLAKLDMEKAISTTFCIPKKKEKKEPPQLLHLDCYKNNNITALQQQPQRKEMIWNLVHQILCLTYYTHYLWSNTNSFNSFITSILALNCVRILHWAMFWDWVQFLKSNWHMLKLFFYLQRWPSWIDKKKYNQNIFSQSDC